MKCKTWMFALSAGTILALSYVSAEGASAPPGLVQSIDTKILLPSLLKVDMKHRWADTRGVVFRLSRNEQDVGSMSIAVVADKKAAASLLESIKMMMSVVPEPPLGGAVYVAGDESVIGRWMALFRRDNVVIDLRSSTLKVEEVARSVDAALMAGENGVTRGRPIALNVIGVELVDGRFQAATSSESLGYTAVVDENGRSCSDHRAAAVCFVTEGCVVAEPMKCSRADLSKKRKAARARAEKAQKRDVPQLEVQEAITLLQDEETASGDRSSAILSLSKVEDATTIIPLLSKYLDPKYDLVVRQHAIQTLGKLGDERGVAPLVKLIEMPVRGNVQDEGENEAILRRRAVGALGDIGDPSVLSALRRIAGSVREYESVRLGAKTAIRKIERKKE